MKFKNLCLISAVFFAGMICASCASWKVDFDKARAEAVKKDKGILLYFSGDSWNSDSVLFENSVLNKSMFRNGCGKEYVFVKLDFESSINEESVSSEMEEKNNFREIYDVKQFPCVYLLSQEGYVKAVIPYTVDISTPQAMLLEMERVYPDVEKIDALAARIRSTEGIEKVYAIDELYDATPENYRLVLNELCKSVLVLDPYNETGLLGKYELQSAYINAIRKAQNQDMDGVENIFCDICQNGHLTADQKQRAYYTAAFVLSAMGCTDYDRIIDLMQLSYNALPKGENSQKVKEVLNSFNQIAFTVKIMGQEDAIISGEQLESNSGNGE